MKFHKCSTCSRWQPRFCEIWQNNNQCLKLSQKSCRSSWLESQIIYIKLKKKKFPGLLQSCGPQTGRPVGISNTDNSYMSFKKCHSNNSCIFFLVYLQSLTILVNLRCSLSRITPTSIIYSTMSSSASRQICNKKVSRKLKAYLLTSVAVNYRYSRYKIDMKISIDNRYGFSDIDISSF